MWQKTVRYLDYNASSGVSALVKDKLIELLSDEDVLANPSSRHRSGQAVQHLIYEASQKIAHSLGTSVAADELVFTASGTEANQTVIRSIAREGEGLIIGSGEHQASYDLLSEIKLPFVYELSLLESGDYDLDALSSLLNLAHSKGIKRVGLSLFWANNETGVLTDLSALGTVLESSPVPVLLHLDGAQVWGKIPFDLNDTPAQYVTFSSHKIGAPAGVGVIWIKPGAPFHPLVLGSQSKGKRGGTENTLGLVATGIAAQALDPARFIAHTSGLRQSLESGLTKLSHRTSFSILLWGQARARVSNTTRFSLADFKSYENWVELLDLYGFAVSHGSACKARVIEPSRVLLKMGASDPEALNSVRVSLGPTNTQNDIDSFLIALEQILLKKKQSALRNEMKS